MENSEMLESSLDIDRCKLVHYFFFLLNNQRVDILPIYSSKHEVSFLFFVPLITENRVVSSTY